MATANFTPNNYTPAPLNYSPTGNKPKKSGSSAQGSGNINLGSSGLQVQQLQQQLKQLGLYEGRIDGIYGPKTQAAVREFQQNAGVQADGIVGPITTSMLQNWAANPHMSLSSDIIIQDAIANDPIAQKTIQGLSKEGGGRADLLASAAEMAKLGYPIDFDTFIDPNKYNSFLEMANKQLDPEFQERLKFARADFEAGLQNERENYAAQLAAKGEENAQEYKQFRQGQANTGADFGSDFKTNSNKLVGSQNAELDALRRDSAFKLSSLARRFENDYGTNDVKNINTNLGSGSMNFRGQYGSGGSSAAYTPMGGFTGRLRSEYSAQAKQLANKKATTYALGFSS